MELDPQNTHAIILSGGGAYAAYEVGVLRALFSGRSPSTGRRPIEPEVVTGTSAGAYNAALLVARSAMSSDAAAAEMERIWLEEVTTNPDGCGNGIYRWRANPLNLFDLRCAAANPMAFFFQRLEDTAFIARSFFDRALRFAASSEPIEQRFLELLNFSNLLSTEAFPRLIERTIDFAAVRCSSVALRVAATNWRTGELRIFANEDMTGEGGPLILRASTAIPGIFPAVTIPPEIFVDGGVLMNTPLAPAIHCGATELHVIYLDPDVRNIPLTDLQATMTTLQRVSSISVAATINHDIEHAATINRGIALLRDGLRLEGAVERQDLDDLLQTVELMREQLARGKQFRKIAIHRYHPGDILGGAMGLLSFERETLALLIERGYQDAVAHDCVASACILPEGVGSPGRGGVTG